MMANRWKTTFWVLFACVALMIVILLLLVRLFLPKVTVLQNVGGQMHQVYSTPDDEALTREWCANRTKVSNKDKENGEDRWRTIERPI